MAPATQQSTEHDPGTAPIVPQTIVATATATLFGGLGIADGGIEPGGYAFAGVAAWFTILLVVVLGGEAAARLPRGVYLGAGLLFALALLAGLSATWSGDAGESVDIAVRSALYAAILIGAAVAVAAGAGRGLIAGLALGGLAIVAVALAGRLISGSLAPSDAAEIQAIAGGRLTSPVGYWNGLGVTGAITAVALIWLGGHAGPSRWRSLAVALAPAAVLTVGMTSSRGAAVGLLGGLAVLALTSPARGRVIGLSILAAAAAAPAFAGFRAVGDLRLGLETSAANRGGIVVLGLLLAGILATYLLSRSLDDRLSGWRPMVPSARALVLIGVVCAALLALAVATTAGDEPDPTLTPGEQAGEIARQSDSYRVSYWTAAFDAWRSEPARGIGAGAYQNWWLADPGEPQPVTHAHSLVFEPLAELGLLGLLLTLGFVGLVAVVGIARTRAQPSGEVQALVAAGFGLFVAVGLPALVDWTWQIPVAMAGLLGGAALVLAGDGAGAGSRRIVAAIVAASVLGLVFSASTYFRVTEIENARTALADLDYEEAIDAAERADMWAPWSADGLEHEAAALSGQGKHGRAAGRVREAIERAPDEWLLWLEAGRLAEARGERDEADFRYGEAERLNQFLEVEPAPADKGSEGDKKKRGSDKKN